MSPLPSDISRCNNYACAEKLNCLRFLNYEKEFTDLKKETEHLHISYTKFEPNKPIDQQKYGWHEQKGFDDEPTGWLFEGGEDAYYEAMEKFVFCDNLIK